MKKIAFCFLIYDIINIEEAWNTFFINIDKNLYNIYIHYKTDVPLKYFNNYKLNNCINTHYADISLVQAQNKLLQEALLHDLENEHFIFLSNSCIPLKPFIFIYNNLNENLSYFNISEHKNCFPRCNDLLKIYDKKYIQKASQWCILNKKHAKIMIKEDEYIHLYNNIYASDEICYITNIFLNNLEKEIIMTLNSSDEATTFTNWQGMNYKYVSSKGLKNYNTIKEEELIHLLNSKSLFGRKFNKECIQYLFKSYYLNKLLNI
jgi:hypothetical protein